MLPHVYNEHISKVYNIYAPYLKNGGGSIGNKYKHDKNMKSIENIKDYHNVYKPKKGNLDNSINMGSPTGQHKIIVNRKLSPLHKKQMIKI